MNKLRMSKNKGIFISLLVTTSELSANQDTVDELFTFLIRYTFLLEQSSKTQNSRFQNIPQLNAPQGNIYMGARYLDPKYSRWISVDPALGEYIPQAPVNDEAKKHNQNLPGMGGVFNSVNLSLFHYAGNNPVRYIDPDGRDIIYKDDDGNEVKREISEKNEIHTPSSDLAMMNENAKEMENNRWNLLLFAKNVKTGGKWDFKNEKNPEHRSFYWFNNKLVSAEEFGNIHYGYVGAAGGFGISLLIDAPGIVQVRQNTAKLSFFVTNFDDPRDTMNILRGYEAYDMSFWSGVCNRVAEDLYTGTALRLDFRIITGGYFIIKNVYEEAKK